MYSTKQHVDVTETDTTTNEDIRTCGECSGRIRKDDKSGEFVCEDCGLVVDEAVIDRGPDWRSFDNEKNTGQKKHIGAPIKQHQHDKGLTTEIGWSNTDAYGNNVSNAKRRQLSRLRREHKRSKTKNSQERSLRHACSEIKRMASALGIGESVIETSSVLFRQCADNGMLPGRSIEGMAAACLYAGARISGVPRTLDEIQHVSHFEEKKYNRNKKVDRAYTYIVRELELEMEPVNPEKYVNRILSELELDDTEAVRQQTLELLEMAKKNNLHSGRSPVTLAGGAVYTAGGIENERILQANVAEITDSAIATIRERYQELYAVYEDVTVDEVCHEFPSP